MNKLLKAINQVEKSMNHSHGCNNRSTNLDSYESCNKCRLQYALAKFEEEESQ